MFANLPIYAVEVIVVANMRGSTATPEHCDVIIEEI